MLCMFMCVCTYIIHVQYKSWIGCHVHVVHVVAVHSQDSIYAATILLEGPKQKTCVNMEIHVHSTLAMAEVGKKER